MGREDDEGQGAPDALPPEGATDTDRPATADAGVPPPAGTSDPNLQSVGAANIDGPSPVDAEEDVPPPFGAPTTGRRSVGAVSRAGVWPPFGAPAGSHPPVGVTDEGGLPSVGAADEGGLPPVGASDATLSPMGASDAARTAAASVPAEPRTIDAEYAVAHRVPPAETRDDEAFTETVEAWQEAEELFDGDGPFAVPIDEPAPTVGAPTPDARPLRTAFDAPSLGPERWRPPQSEPLVLRRRTGGSIDDVGPRDVRTADAARASTRRSNAGRAGPRPRPYPVRRYPRMLALLRDQTVADQPGAAPSEASPARVSAQTVPPPGVGRPPSMSPPVGGASGPNVSGTSRAQRPPAGRTSAPPVPGTFFPAPRAPKAPPPSDLDGMLLTMAEGLLIGETAEGETEVRVTLKDEFFAGTELRIVAGEGKVRAVLAPPDRDVYWQLNGSLEELRNRLADRGLNVEDIELVYP